MVNQEILEIILKAQDQASSTTQKVDDQLKKIGDTAQKTGQRTAQSSQMTRQQMQQLSTKLADVSRMTEGVGQKGASQFKRYNSSVQDSIVKFNMLDQETQEWLTRLGNASNPKIFYELNSKCQEAVAKFNQLENVTNTWSGALDYSKSKVELLGTPVDSLKGKFQATGNAIQMYIGNKWDSIKGKVSSFGNYIKTQLGNALSSVKSKLDSLGSAFSGLGGIISSAIGAIGMNSIKDLTVGLAMNRDRMTSLTSAVMGGDKAGQSFVNTMDKLTDNSLVSLDNLGQAMSTIKMSTGMSNEELKNFTSTVNDVGQRAILMGYDGDQAMSLMQAAGRGLNGEFDMLKSNFGITKDQLESLGWSGAADDVAGYQKALDKALEAGGSMEGMMNTTTGKLEILKKNFRVAGRHVGEMFTPYIEQAVDWLNGLKDTCPGIFENLVMVAGAVSMFATVAPAISPVLTALEQIGSISKGALVFVGLLEAEEGALTASGLAASASQTMLSIAEAAGADAAVLETAANGGLTASFWAMSAAILANPLTWVAVALIAIAVAVYEVGKSFGWWTDVGSMLDAIWSGIQRVWDAFINHPDVQAMLSALSAAWDWLSGAIGNAIEWISSFFNISTSGEFDIVQAIINGVGAAWDNLKGVISAIVGVVQSVASAFSGFYNDNLVPFAEWLSSVFAPVWTFIGDTINAIMPFVNNLTNAFTQFQNSQLDLPGLILTVLTSLLNMYITILSQIAIAVSTWAFNILSAGISAASNFVMGIINRIMVLPRRFLTYLLRVLTNIITSGARWVTAAKQKASQLVNGVINFLKTLPGKAYTALYHVVTKIISVGQQWVTAAKQKAKSIVDGVYNTLTGTASKVADALNGVKDAIVKPFKDAYDQAKKIWDNITSLGGVLGGEPAYGGETLDVNANRNFNISTGEYIVDDSPIVIEDNINLSLDLSGVPRGVNTAELVNAIQDRDVLNALVSNRDFQDLDARVKQRINLKNVRARGR